MNLFRTRRTNQPVFPSVRLEFRDILWVNLVEKVTKPLIEIETFVPIEQCKAIHLEGSSRLFAINIGNRTFDRVRIDFSEVFFIH